MFQTTLTAWAFVDPCLFFLCIKATEILSTDMRTKVLLAIGFWIFVFAKSIKLMGHWIRYPADIALLPLSILFGYMHGFIKLIGLLTLSEVSTLDDLQVADGMLTIPYRPLGAAEMAQTTTTDTV